MLMMQTVVHFVGEIKRHCHEHILHEIVGRVPNVRRLMPPYIGVASYHRLTVGRTKL